ncbi:MAG: prepilin-type N-terminal cleavage/methylation domain-containing protein [Phycisphaerales bacterium]|nr:MAG: prepilin-type N-terminal cleavage/methylation domain-containing protein [Phycisphaerales bacterium]
MGSASRHVAYTGKARASAPGFTLIELLVVVAIIGALIAIIVPAVSVARKQAKATTCLASLHALGQGITIYAGDNGDVMLPGRLPKLDACNAYAELKGGRKYRPTFIAVLGSAIGVAPFADPQACQTDIDRFGEPGDRQNYWHATFVCPSVRYWTDERNGCYGYNYQFLGNSRLLDPEVPDSYKNWPVPMTRIRYPGSTVAVADCMGTAASWPVRERLDYSNNSRDAQRFGNEGFNLDPPRVDATNGEMAKFDRTPQSRTAADPRHRKRAGVLWLDAHADARTLAGLGYQVQPDGVIGFEGDNRQWSGQGTDISWTRSTSR